MKYLFACLMLLCATVASADTLTIKTPEFVTTINGHFLGLTETKQGELIEFNATSINTVSYIDKTPKVIYPREEVWYWQGSLGAHSSYDGAGVCYTAEGSQKPNVVLQCSTASTTIEPPTCGPSPPCP